MILPSNEWLYKGQPFDANLIGVNEGFVYLIRHIETGKKYVGKKSFWSTTSKVNKITKKRKYTKIESDWKEYWSSSKELQAVVKQEGREAFTREIIELAPSSGVLSYLELRLQMDQRVLERDDYFNSFVGARINRSHLKALK